MAQQRLEIQQNSNVDNMKIILCSLCEMELILRHQIDDLFQNNSLIDETYKNEYLAICLQAEKMALIIKYLHSYRCLDFNLFSFNLSIFKCASYDDLTYGLPDIHNYQDYIDKLVQNIQFYHPVDLQKNDRQILVGFALSLVSLGLLIISMTVFSGILSIVFMAVFILLHSMTLTLTFCQLFLTGQQNVLYHQIMDDCVPNVNSAFPIVRSHVDWDSPKGCIAIYIDNIIGSEFNIMCSMPSPIYPYKENFKLNIIDTLTREKIRNAVNSSDILNQDLNSGELKQKICAAIDNRNFSRVTDYAKTHLNCRKQYHSSHILSAPVADLKHTFFASESKLLNQFNTQVDNIINSRAA